MAGGWLSTHLLDTMHGRPAAGMHFDLFLVHGDHGHHLLSGVTNEDGRADGYTYNGQYYEGAPPASSAPMSTPSSTYTGERG